jgi:hypothetical protein
VDIPQESNVKPVKAPVLKSISGDVRPNSIDLPIKKKPDVIKKTITKGELKEAASSSVHLAITSSLLDKECELIPKSPSSTSISRRRLRQSYDSPLMFMDFSSADDLLITIPIFIVVKILSLLEIKDLVAASMTSKEWKIISEDMILWKPLFRRDFPNLNPEQRLMGSIVLRNWKDLYAQFGN